MHWDYQAPNVDPGAQRQVRLAGLPEVLQGKEIYQNGSVSGYGYFTTTVSFPEEMNVVVPEHLRTLEWERLHSAATQLYFKVSGCSVTATPRARTQSIQSGETVYGFQEIDFDVNLPAGSALSVFALMTDGS